LTERQVLEIDSVMGWVADEEFGLTGELGHDQAIKRVRRAVRQKMAEALWGDRPAGPPLMKPAAVPHYLSTDPRSEFWFEHFGHGIGGCLIQHHLPFSISLTSNCGIRWQSLHR